MRRRRLLAALAGAGTVGAAGCSGTDASFSEIARSCGGQGPKATCFGDGPVVWEDRAAAMGSPLALRSEADTVELPFSEVAFTMENGTDDTVSSGLCFTLWKWAGGRWVPLAPEICKALAYRIDPGEAHRWLAAGRPEAPRARERDTRANEYGDRRLAVDGLGPGLYAYTVDVSVPDEDSDDGHTPFTLASTVGVEGPKLTIPPSRFVESARREGDRVVVTAPGPGETETNFRLRRPDSADGEEVWRVPLERAIAYWPLRDALAHLEPDVREVVVWTSLRYPKNAHTPRKFVEIEGVLFETTVGTPSGRF